MDLNEESFTIRSAKAKNIGKSYEIKPLEELEEIEEEEEEEESSSDQTRCVCNSTKTFGTVNQSKLFIFITDGSM